MRPGMVAQAGGYGALMTSSPHDHPEDLLADPETGEAMPTPSGDDSSTATTDAATVAPPD